MAVVEADVLLARSLEAVFDFVGEASNLPLWDSSILEAEQVEPGPLELGTRWRGVSKILGRRFEWTAEVTQVERPSSMSSRAVEGDLRFTVTNTFRSEDGGTRFTYRVEAEPGLGGVFGRLTDPLVEKAQQRTVKANLDTLAELMSQPAP